MNLFTIRRCSTLIEAQAVARHLLEHGVLAVVQHTLLRRGELFPGMGSISVFGPSDPGEFTVQVRRPFDEELIGALLAVFDAEPVELDDAWESEIVEPDLSRLDPSLAPACPGCGAVLPLDRPVDACPACSFDVDVPELIAAQHGPAALADCYPEADDGLELGGLERGLGALPLGCTSCGYPLGGLPGEGTCPECGASYGKIAIVRLLLDPSARRGLGLWFEEPEIG